MTILDHVADTAGAELHRLACLYPLPDYVKQASIDDARPGRKVAAAAYGDPVNKLYPCHNRPSTFLSLLFFAEKRAEFHPKIADMIQRRLDQFVRYWGMKQAQDVIAARYAELYKDAESRLPDGDFGYVWTGDDGKKTRYLRMKSAAEVKAAAGWLLQYRDRLPFKDRHVVANKILEKAAQYGAALGDELDRFIDRQAGRGVCEPADVVTMIRQRVTFTKDASARQQITALADAVADGPRFSLLPDMLVKLASVVDDVDRKAGLVGKYTDTIRRPEDVLFSVTYKEAAAGFGNAVTLSTGRVYDRGQFKKIALHDVQALLGGEVADAVADGLNVNPEKLAEVAETMPRDDAEMFEQILASTGIPPIHLKASGDRYGLRADAQAALAGAY